MRERKGAAGTRVAGGAAILLANESKRKYFFRLHSVMRVNNENEITLISDDSVCPLRLL